MAKSIKELVESLTPQERLQFQSLIKELLQNEVELLSTKENSMRLLNELNFRVKNILDNLEQVTNEKVNQDEAGVVDYLINLPIECFHKV